MKRTMHYISKQARKVHLTYCVLCQAGDSLEQHRIDPNGTYEDSNVMCVCRPCHMRLHRLLKFEDTMYEELTRGNSWADKPQKRSYEDLPDEEEEVWGED